jgi:hypothetical protein
VSVIEKRMVKHLNLEEMKNDYISYGGLPEELESITDESVIELMVNSQKQIHELLQKEKEGDDSAKSDLEKLQELKEIPFPEIGTEEYILHTNNLVELENKIRSRFNLPAKPKEYTDKDLVELLTLDDMRIGQNCNMFLQSIENLGTRKDYQYRLQRISNTLGYEARAQEEHLEFLSVTSENLETLSQNPLERWIQSKNGSVVANRMFQVWKDELLEIRRKLQARIRADASVEKDSGGEFKPDKRTSVYKLKSKVDSLIEKYHLEE